MTDEIVKNFKEYLDRGYTIDEKEKECQRLCDLLRAKGNHDAIKQIKDAFEEYLIDGRAWVDMEQSMSYTDDYEDF